MRKKLLGFISISLLSTAAFCQTYFTENFDAGVIPAGWTQTTLASDGGWKFGTSASLSSTSFTFPSTGSNIVATNDDACNCDKSADRLILPSVNLTTATAPYLLYDQFYFAGTYGGATEICRIEASIDSGATWSLVSVMTSNASGAAFESKAASLATYVGQPSVKVSILYNDGAGFLFGAGLDNVSIVEPPVGRDLAVQSLSSAMYLPVIPAYVSASAVGVGQKIEFGFNVKNTKSTMITSFDATVSASGGGSRSQTFTGLSLGYLAAIDLQFDSSLAALAGLNNYTLTISNINGTGADDDVSNNTGTATATAYTLNPTKKFVVEEGTGTWCGYCVRGAVMVDYLSSAYPDNFIGIAVHNADPMTVPEYDTYMGTKIGGYPSCLGDRQGTECDPSPQYDPSIYGRMFERASIAPLATVALTAEMNSASRALVVNSTATYTTNLSGDYRINVVLTEDGVLGDGTTPWEQHNYYAGGSLGPMGGMESLASSIVGFEFNHVARAILGGINGTTGSLPASGTSGSSYSYAYNYTVPAEYNASNMKAIAMVIDATTGEIVNAQSAPLTIVAGINDKSTDASLNVYPNPTTGKVIVDLNLANSMDASVKVYSVLGAMVAQKDLGTMHAGTNSNSIDLTNLDNGVYMIQVTTGDQVTTRRVVLNK